MTLTATPQLGSQTVIFIATTPAGTPTVHIGGNTTIEPPQPKWGTEDVTTLDTPNNSESFIKTLINQGTAKLTGLWLSVDAGQIALYNAYLASSNQVGGSAYPFKIVLPINLKGGQVTTGDTATFSAHVTEFAMGRAEPKKAVPYSATIVVEGSVLPTYTEGA